jgi:hypothetical protein
MSLSIAQETTGTKELQLSLSGASHSTVSWQLHYSNTIRFVARDKVDNYLNLQLVSINSNNLTLPKNEKARTSKFELRFNENSLFPDLVLF